MTTHEVAKKLLESPPQPMICPGTGSDEGFWFPVSLIKVDEFGQVWLDYADDATYLESK